MGKKKKLWYNEPIETLKEAVEEGNKMIVLPLDFAQQLLDEIESLKRDVEIAHKNEIWGFHEEEFPIYTSRKDMCPELSSRMTVEEANHLVKNLEEIFILAKLRNTR